MPLLAFIRAAMEPSFLLVLLFVIAVIVAQNRAKERREKLRILEQALQGGDLDEAAKADLMAELTGRKRAQERPAQPATSHEQPRGSLFGRLLFGLGWLGMILGLGFLCADDHDLFEAGVIVGSVSLGLMTLPLAVREYDRGAVRRDA